jgi:ribosomal protein L29
MATKKANNKKSAPKKTESGDKKSLAAKARQIKKELLAIRFNLQSPSIKEYRARRKELRETLSQFGVVKGQ